MNLRTLLSALLALISLAVIFLTQLASAILDRDADGMSDVWESQFGFSPTSSTLPAQLPAADPDGDGVSNLLEAIAGTNPLSTAPPTGTFRLVPSPTQPSLLQWHAVLGKNYQFYSSSTLTTSSWTLSDQPLTFSPGNIGSVTTPSPTASRGFYRASVTDRDTDTDTLTDTEELALGTKIDSIDSDGDGIPDDQEVIQNSNPTDAADLGLAPYITPPTVPPLKLRIFTGTLLGSGYVNNGLSGFLSIYTINIFKRNMQTGVETQFYSIGYSGNPAALSADIELPNDGSTYSAQIDLPNIGNTDTDAPFRDFSFIVGISPNPGSSTFTCIDGYDPSTQQYGSIGQFLGAPKVYNSNYEKFRAIISPVTLDQLSFSGPKYHELKSDDLTLTHSAPHWKTAGPGELLFPSAAINALAGARNYSLAYTSGSKATIGGKFKLSTAAPLTLPYKIRATSPGGINIPATPLAVSLLGELTLPPTESTTAFPAAISKFYDKSAAATAFNLTWELSVNNGAWIKLITTYHQLYLTKNDPVFPPPLLFEVPLPGNLETAFYLACNLSNGKTLADDIVTSIYGEFTDRRVYGIHKILGDPAGVPLTFWGTPRSEFQNRTGHLLTSGFAVCRGWADFLKQVISIHGIPASSIDVKINSGTSISAEAYSSDLSDGGAFVVKPIIIPPGGAASSESLPSFYLTGGVPIKIPAQGRPDGNTNWPGHVITRYNSPTQGSIYFDPSYGSPLAVGIGSVSAETQYSLGLAGFKGKNVEPFTFGKVRWWQPDPSNLDINFTIAP